MLEQIIACNCQKGDWRILTVSLVGSSSLQLVKPSLRCTSVIEECSQLEEDVTFCLIV